MRISLPFNKKENEYLSYLPQEGETKIKVSKLGPRPSISSRSDQYVPVRNGWHWMEPDAMWELRRRRKKEKQKEIRRGECIRLYSPLAATLLFSLRSTGSGSSCAMSSFLPLLLQLLLLFRLNAFLLSRSNAFQYGNIFQYIPVFKILIEITGSIFPSTICNTLEEIIPFILKQKFPHIADTRGRCSTWLQEYLIPHWLYLRTL